MLKQLLPVRVTWSSALLKNFQQGWEWPERSAEPPAQALARKEIAQLPSGLPAFLLFFLFF